LPDGLVRDLLDDTLVVQFGHGAYEAGIDALISRVMATLDDDSALRRANESTGSWIATIRSALIRSPRLAWRAWRIFVDSDLNGRFAIELFVLVAVYVVGFGLFFAYKVLAALILLPRHWRESPARLAQRVARERNAVLYDGREIERPPSIVDLLGDLRLKDIALGSWGFAFCLAVVVGILLQVQNILPRKGHFGGAGVTVIWPMPPGTGPR
jgi:uncharacterized membrane protein YgcG